MPGKYILMKNVSSVAIQEGKADHFSGRMSYTVHLFYGYQKGTTHEKDLTLLKTRNTTLKM